MTSVSRKHSSNKGIQMSKLQFKRKIAVVALAAAVVLGGGAAFAYPPGEKLEVAAQAQALPAGGVQVTVTVTNSNPSCSTRVRVDGNTEVVLAPGETTTTIVVATTKKGRHKVRARTVDCLDGQKKEHAKSDFVIAAASATGNPTSPKGKNYEVELTGLEPGSTVTSTATLATPMTQLVDSDKVDKRGEATVKFKLKKSGTWVISTDVSPATEVDPVTVVVP
jgi:hypothetical protein